jgi:hypothetical protein
MEVEIPDEVNLNTIANHTVHRSRLLEDHKINKENQNNKYKKAGVSKNIFRRHLSQCPPQPQLGNYQSSLDTLLSDSKHNSNYKPRHKDSPGKLQTMQNQANNKPIAKEKEAPTLSAPTEILLCTANDLIASVKEGNFTKIREIIGSKYYQHEWLSVEDANKDTPLMIATKIACSSNDFSIIKAILHKHSNPTKKNSIKMSAMDIAIICKNIKLASLLNDAAHACKHRTWLRKRDMVFSKLKALPDCYMEIKFNCSSYIPFLSLFTPSDTYRIWKVGSSLRVSFNFLGMYKRKIIKSNTTMILKEGQDNIIIVDEQNKAYFSAFDKPSKEEKVQIITYMFQSTPVQARLNISSIKFKQLSTKTKVVNAIKCRRFELQVHAQVNSKQISLDDSVTVEKNKKKNMSFYIWAAEHFPLSIKLLLDVIKPLSQHNHQFRTLKMILSDPGVHNLVENEGFPIKIRVPINMVVSAVINFKNYQPFWDTSVFDMPPEFKRMPRSECFPNILKYKGAVFANLQI